MILKRIAHRLSLQRILLSLSFSSDLTKVKEPSAKDIADYSRSIGLGKLVSRTKYRFPLQPEQPDLLPDLDNFDTNAALQKLTDPTKGSLPPSRRAMQDQLELIRCGLAGRPELLLWHALSISYLRRQTRHTEKAKAIFFRIWDEQGHWLAENLNARWLVSALQTFADHGRSPSEAKCGAVGFLYGNMIKIYEVEIASAYTRQETTGAYRPSEVCGLFEFQPGDDILVNINSHVFTAAIDAGGAGLALVRLLAIVKDGGTIFARTDSITLAKGQGFLSFSGSIRKK